MIFSKEWHHVNFFEKLVKEFPECDGYKVRLEEARKALAEKAATIGKR